MVYNIDTCVLNGEVVYNIDLVNAYHYVLTEVYSVVSELLNNNDSVGGVNKQMILDTIEYLISGTDAGACIRGYLSMEGADNNMNDEHKQINTNATSQIVEFPELEDVASVSTFGVMNDGVHVADEQEGVIGSISFPSNESSSYNDKENNQPNPINESVLLTTSDMPYTDSTKTTTSLSISESNPKKENMKLSGLARLQMRMANNKKSTASVTSDDDNTPPPSTMTVSTNS